MKTSATAADRSQELLETRMAATARRRDPDEDIAAIAKQISDQAEAIYQNWKSRGLAPAELIACHAAGDTAKLG